MRPVVGPRGRSSVVVVVLNALSAFLYIVYLVMAILVLELPPKRFPYAISILGAAVMCVLAVKAAGARDRGSVTVGYVLTALNIFASCGAMLTVIAYLTGPDSGLSRVMNFVPFPK
jgi:ABC-type Fe3+-siderophore transport system permease subunit